jgi:apolipoprotein N-acyltransferase
MMSRRLRLSLAVAAGGIAAFGLAPYGLWPLTLAGLFVAGWLSGDATSRVGCGWVFWFFGFGYFSHGLIWLAEPFLVDAAMHGWMIPFAVVGMAGGLSVFWFFAGWLGFGRGVLIALLISLAELARGYVLTGFPWGGLAQIWVDTAIAQSLAWIGPYGLGGLTALAAVPLGVASSPRDHAGRQKGKQTGNRLRDVAMSVAAIASLAVFWISPAPEVATTNKVVRLVQANAPQQQRWDPQWVPEFFSRHLRLTASDAPLGPVDLVVWSETSVPWLLSNADGALRAISKVANAPVVAGVQHFNGEGYYNSVALIGRDGSVEALYDKHHLVPFGEYMPLASVVSGLGIRGLAERADGGYRAGSGPQVIDLPGLGVGLPLICYEAIFPHNVRGTRRPDVLIAVTNDAWFGNWSGPYQHLAQARMRAIESGLPMVRVANTGISAMIDPLGRITSYLPLNVAGSVDALLPAPLTRTLYSRTGDWLAFCLLLIAAMLSATLRRVN